MQMQCPSRPSTNTASRSAVIVFVWQRVKRDQVIILVQSWVTGLCLQTRRVQEKGVQEDYCAFFEIDLCAPRGTEPHVALQEHVHAKLIH